MAEENKSIENENTTPEGEKSVILEENKNDLSQEVNSSTNETKEENNSEEFVSKKRNLPLKKILIIVIVFLLILILVGAVVFFLKMSHKNENNTHESEKTEATTHATTNEDKPKDKEETNSSTNRYEIKDLNSKKLNELLSSLNNKNIVSENKNEKKQEENIEEDENIKRERLILEDRKFQLEKEKLHAEEQKKDTTLIKEPIEAGKASEPQKAEQSTTQSIEQKEDNKNTPKEKEQSVQNNMGKFINVVKIKGELKKKYLDKVVEVDPNLHLCRDNNNKIEIYYGPFNDDNKRDELFEKLIKKGFKQANKLELTIEEYNKRCNY